MSIPPPCPLPSHECPALVWVWRGRCVEKRRRGSFLAEDTRRDGAPAKSVLRFHQCMMHINSMRRASAQPWVRLSKLYTGTASAPTSKYILLWAIIRLVGLLHEDVCSWYQYANHTRYLERSFASKSAKSLRARTNGENKTSNQRTDFRVFGKTRMAYKCRICVTNQS